MNVFVINSGSSSIKYQLIRMPQAEVICSGMVDRIGQEGSSIHYKTFLDEQGFDRKDNIPIKDHASGLKEVSRLLTDPELGVIRNPTEIEVVGHGYLNLRVGGITGGASDLASSLLFIRKSAKGVVASPRFFLMLSMPRMTGPRLVQ